MNHKEYEIIRCGDGSATLKIKDSEISFHSSHGAIQESQHVFIDAGLKHFKEKHPGFKKIKIFEVGFGTGLNALLTAIQAPKIKTTIEYHAIDLHPLPDDLFFKLNYAEILNEFELFKTITQTPWNQLVFITPFFKLKKIEADLTAYASNEKFDIIYFDAFAPDDQPELWTEDIFKKIFEVLNSRGMLVTYCSKTIVQKALTAVGFTIEKIQGPHGKREILRATRS